LSVRVDYTALKKILLGETGMRLEYNCTDYHCAAACGTDDARRKSIARVRKFLLLLLVFRVALLSAIAFLIFGKKL
jgi:hypothetical protein